MKYLVISILLIGWNGTKKILFMYPLPVFRIFVPLIRFTTEEITGCTNEAAKGAKRAPRNPSSCSFISCFTVSVTPSINSPESFNYFII